MTVAVAYVYDYENTASIVGQYVFDVDVCEAKFQ
jgi:hypothetical protein